MDTDSGVGLWTAAGAPLWTRPMTWPYTCALAADGTAYVGNRSNEPALSSLHRIRREGKNSAKKLPFGGLSGLDLSPDGATLALVGDSSDQKPRLYNASKLGAEPVCLKKGNGAGRMQRIYWSTEGRLLTLAEKSHRTPSLTVGVRDVGARGMLWAGLADNALLLSHERLVTWTHSYMVGVQLWALGDPAPDAPIASRVLPGVKLYPQGNLAAVLGGQLAVSQNDRLYILSAVDLEEVAVLEGAPWSHQGVQLAASPSGRFLLVSDVDNSTLVELHAEL